jgi:hypothetical protein
VVFILPSDLPEESNSNSGNLDSTIIGLVQSRLEPDIRRRLRERRRRDRENIHRMLMTSMDQQPSHADEEDEEDD